MYPLRPPVQVPTFIGAWAGADERLPTWQHAFSDPRAKNASELMVRLLRERAAYEANLFDENNNFLIAPSVFPYFYALVGERNPKQPPKPGPRSEYSQLACDAFAVIEKEGPISKQKLRARIGGEPSLAALDRALAELWSRLRITRVRGLRRYIPAGSPADKPADTVACTGSYRRSCCCSRDPDGYIPDRRPCPGLARELPGRH